MNPLTGKVALAPSLSPREVEVLRLIWDGHATKAIAELLAVSPKTINVYRGNLLLKLRAANTAQLLKAALEADLLTVHS